MRSPSLRRPSCSTLSPGSSPGGCVGTPRLCRLYAMARTPVSPGGCFCPPAAHCSRNSFSASLVSSQAWTCCAGSSSCLDLLRIKPQYYAVSSSWCCRSLRALSGAASATGFAAYRALVLCLCRLAQCRLQVDTSSWLACVGSEVPAPSAVMVSLLAKVPGWSVTLRQFLLTGMLPHRANHLCFRGKDCLWEARSDSAQLRSYLGVPPCGTHD